MNNATMKSTEINVTIQLIGGLARFAGQESLKVTVPRNIDQAIGSIVTYLKTYYSLEGSYLILVNDQNLVLLKKQKKTHFLMETDVIKIVPIVSGG
jgi:molybdopterin converting factor small subunit